ncbi:MAG: restriction endonuclease subunit S [Nanoarchaeota archaeon]|jgi:type I restriction enzyme S subunit|nr:restriction endonuclease subunit S [Nanoarchaeota archaeon]
MVRSNWQTKTLGEVCDKGSSNISLNKIQENEGDYPIYGAKGFLKKVDFYHQEKPYISIIKDGAGVGRVNLQEAKSSVIGTLQYILPKENIDINFLYYFLLGVDFEKYSCGAAIPHIYFKDYEKEELMVPPLDEQKEIVKILNEVFESIFKSKENAEKNLKNTKELFESYLEEIFSNPKEDWEEKTLREITSKLGDGLHGTPKYDEKGEYYFINGNNLNDGKINIKENTKKVSFEEYKKHKKELNDRTVFVSINGTLGNVAFYDNEKIILGKSACYFNLLQNIDKNFIKYNIQSPVFFRYLEKEYTGATIKNISLKSMREYKIYFPKSISEQKTIVQKLDALSKEIKELESIYKQKVKDLDELKKSMLQKAFSGELTK